MGCKEGLSLIDSVLMRQLKSVQAAQLCLISAEMNLLNAQVPEGSCTFPGYLFVTYKERNFECTG